MTGAIQAYQFVWGMVITIGSFVAMGAALVSSIKSRISHLEKEIEHLSDVRERMARMETKLDLLIQAKESK